MVQGLGCRVSPKTTRKASNVFVLAQPASHSPPCYITEHWLAGLPSNSSSDGITIKMIVGMGVLGGSVWGGISALLRAGAGPRWLPGLLPRTFGYSSSAGSQRVSEGQTLLRLLSSTAASPRTEISMARTANMAAPPFTAAPPLDLASLRNHTRFLRMAQKDVI